MYGLHAVKNHIKYGMLLKLALRNIFSRKSSFVICAFIAVCVMTFVFTNAVFDSTEKGAKNTFCRSFTGDVFIRPVSDSPVSLFGDETPVIGSLTKTETLTPYEEIVSLLKETSAIKKFTPQVSCNVLMEFSKVRRPCCLFGVDGDSYLKTMPLIKIKEGSALKAGECMISSVIAEETGAKTGSTIQFTIADGISFRIRALKVSAVYEYEVYDKSMDKIVLADPVTVRELLGVSSAVKNLSLSIAPEIESLFSADTDDDSLFFNEDLDTEKETSSIFTDREIAVQNEEDVTWNFIVCSVFDSESSDSVMKNLNQTFKEKGWNVEAASWRDGAGTAALYLYWLRLVFNAGIFVVLFAGFIVISNSLVLRVIDRTKEIGTLRALGAERKYISFECMTETLILTCGSGLIGILLGIFVSSLCTKASINFTNAFLIQLFGGSTLTVTVGIKNVISALVLSFIIGVIAWIHPSRKALAISPAVAIQGAE